MKSIRFGLLGVLLATMAQAADAGEVNAAVAANFTRCADLPFVYPPEGFVFDRVDPKYLMVYGLLSNAYVHYLSLFSLLSGDKPWLMLETGAPSVELGAHVRGPAFGVGDFMVGITNYQDNQEQVDVIEAEANAFFEKEAFAGKLKGYVYFADEAVWPHSRRAYQYYLSYRNKALSGYLKKLYHP